MMSSLPQTYEGKALPCPDPGDLCEGIPHLTSLPSPGTRVLESERDTWGKVYEILLCKYWTYTVLGSGDSAVNKSLSSWGLKSNWGGQQSTNRQTPARNVLDTDEHLGEKESRASREDGISVKGWCLRGAI